MNDRFCRRVGGTGFVARRIRASVVASIIASAVGSPALGDATPSSWLTAFSGRWSSGANWTSAPDSPKNDYGVGRFWTATIDAVGSPYAVTIESMVVLDAFRLNSADATVSLEDAILCAPVGGIRLDRGVLRLAGTSATSPSTVLRSRIDTGSVGAGSVRVEGAANAFDSVDLAAPVVVGAGSAATLQVLQYLHLDGGVISLASGSTLTLGYGVSVNGAGEIRFDGPADGAIAGDVWVGPDVTIRTGAGGGTIGRNAAAVHIDGRVVSDAPGRTITVEGRDVTRLGHLHAESGGVIRIASALSTGAIGGLSVDSGGKIMLANTLSHGGRTLTLDTPQKVLTLHSGTIRGGTIRASNGGGIAFEAGSTNTLDGVEYHGDFTVRGTLNLPQGMTLHGNRVNLAGPVNVTGGLDGTGEVVFDTATSVKTNRIGTGVVIRSGASGGIVQLLADGQMQGTVSARTPGQQVQVMGTDLRPFTNAGTLEAAGGGLLRIHAYNFGNSGVIRAAGGSTVELWMPNGWFANTGSMELEGSTLVLDGTYSTGAIPPIERVNSYVVLNGTVQNAGRTLALEAFGGGWSVGAVGISGGQVGTPGSGGVVPLGAGNVLGLHDVILNADLEVMPTGKLTFGTGFDNRATVRGSGAAIDVTGRRRASARSGSPVHSSVSAPR